MGTTTSTETDSLPYRPCVGITLFNREGLVFVGHRITSNEHVHWQMPQGGIDQGESPREAAMRELGEEVGTNRADILAEASDWYVYELPRPLMGRALRGRFRGQRQKWFAMRFAGDDSEINLNAHRPPEFDDWKWVPFAQVIELIIPFKRHVYEEVVREFSHLAVPESGA